MFLFYFSTNNIEIVTYAILVVVFFGILFIINYVDRYLQNKNAISKNRNPDFFSKIGFDYDNNINSIYESRVITSIKNNILPFSETKFKALVADFTMLYVDLWKRKNIHLLKKYTTLDLYDETKKTLNIDISQNFSSFIEDFSIAQMYISNYESTNENEEVSVKVFFSAKAYTLNKDGDVVQGSRKEVRNFHFTIKFIIKSLIKEDFESYIIPMTICKECHDILTVDDEGFCDSCNLNIQGGFSHWIASEVSLDVLANPDHEV